MQPDHLLFLDQFDLHLQDAQARGKMLALVLVQIPCVSRVDCLLGYRLGDEVASRAAQQLTQVLKSSDRIYRIDRATLACVLTDLQTAAQAWSGAFKILNTLGRQVEVGEHFIQAAPIAGLACFPEHGNAPDQLLQRATLALSNAPQARDHIAVFDSSQDRAGKYELALQSYLKRAVDENGLALQFQAKMDLASGRIVAAEALSRWEHPQYGAINPSVFIRAAENAGWMPGLTRWLLHACLRQWQSVPSGLEIAVNLSAQDLNEPDLPALIAQALATWNLPAQRLTLEITETAVMEQEALLADNLRQLRDMGLRLAIDDFGTGYSSLARLKQLPVDEIKIDLTFVRNLPRSEQDQRMVRSIIDLAHNLGLVAVAEGVEEEATLQLLRDMGCDVAQGHFISPPRGLDDFLRFVQAHPHGSKA